MTIPVLLVAAATAAVPPHPRLVANADDFAALKARIARSSLARDVASNVVAAADRQIGRPPIRYELDESNRRLRASRDAVGRICRLAMAYRLTGERKYADAAIAVAKTAAAFKDWLPSHFLGTAEMTFAVSIGYDWLYDELSAADRAALEEAILRKGLTTGGKTLHTGWWVKTDNNWCQVCNGGMLAGAVAVADRAPDVAQAVIDRAIDGLPVAMSVFAPDGGFPEGFGYWSYAMCYNTIAISILEKFLGTDRGLCAMPGLAAEADFRDLCTGPTGLIFNYADVKTTRRGIDQSQWWIAKRFNRPDSLVAFEAADLRERLERPDPDGNALGIFSPFLLLNLIEPEPDLRPGAPLCRVLDGPNPIVSMRTAWNDPEAWYLGAKGGSTGVNHSHMDIGTFVLDAMGVRWSYELGSESYARIENSRIGSAGLWNRRQDSPRWSLFRYAAEGHSTFQVGHRRQEASKCARFAPMAAGWPARAVLDTSGTYEGLGAATRTFTLEERGGASVADDLAGLTPGETVTWRMNTKATVKLDGTRVVLSGVDDKGGLHRMVVRLDGPEGVNWQVRSIERMGEIDAPNPGFSQLYFETKSPADGHLAWKVSFEADTKGEEE